MNTKSVLSDTNPFNQSVPEYWSFRPGSINQDLSSETFALGDLSIHQFLCVGDHGVEESSATQ
jgi:hypothetical protein